MDWPGFHRMLVFGQQFPQEMATTLETFTVKRLLIDLQSEFRKLKATDKPEV